jgi:hypothetical protein
MGLDSPFSKMIEGKKPALSCFIGILTVPPSISSMNQPCCSGHWRTIPVHIDRGVPKAGHGESKTVFVPALWYKIEGIVDADREFPPPA